MYFQFLSDREKQKDITKDSQPLFIFHTIQNIAGTCVFNLWWGLHVLGYSQHKSQLNKYLLGEQLLKLCFFLHQTQKKYMFIMVMNTKDEPLPAPHTIN